MVDAGEQSNDVVKSRARAYASNIRRRLSAVPSADASFVAVVFEAAAATEEALSTVRKMNREQDVSIRDAAVVIRTASGRIELQQTREIAPGEAIVGGGTIGLVAGLLLGLPVGGALLGLAGGTIFGMRDRGIPDRRLRKLGAGLQPGQAVLCVLVDAGEIERVREALGRYGPVLDLELSPGPGP